MIEFAIVALPVLFIGLGSVELAHWFYTRQVISVALLDAGRSAITNHNQASHIIPAFEQALKPLYAAPTAAATAHRLRDALTRRQARMNAAPWQIEVLSPSASAYHDFSDPGLRIDGASGRPVINNHYLAEQDLRFRDKGWPDGRGPASGQTIYEANTAVLRLSWLHEPRVPLIVPLLRSLGNSQGTYRQRALAQGYLPMTRQMTLLMHSHPVHWTDDPSNKIIYRDERATTTPPCKGWLCTEPVSNSHIPRTPDLPSPGSGPTPPAPPTQANPPVPQPGHGDALVSPGSGGSDLSISPDDPACGVTLCCV